MPHHNPVVCVEQLRPESKHPWKGTVMEAKCEDIRRRMAKVEAAMADVQATWKGRV